MICVQCYIYIHVFLIQPTMIATVTWVVSIYIYTYIHIHVNTQTGCIEIPMVEICVRSTMGISQFSIYDVVHMCPTIFKVHQFQNVVILQGEVFVPSIVPQVFPYVPIFIQVSSIFQTQTQIQSVLNMYVFSGKNTLFFLRIFHYTVSSSNFQHFPQFPILFPHVFLFLPNIFPQFSQIVPYVF